MIRQIDNILKRQSYRTKQLSKNVLYIAFFKFGSILSNFLLIPITINYVSSPIYGIWMTLYSIISWLSIFDIGLGNGLRNNLTKCLVEGNYKDAKEYVSTAYVSLIFISLLLFSVIFFSVFLLNWNDILKLPNDFSENINNIIIILGFGFCLRFLFQIISTIFFAIQKPFLTEYMTFVSNILVLLVVYFFKDDFSGKLQFLVFSLCFPPVIIMFIFSVYLFSTQKYKSIVPSFIFFKMKKIKSLMTLSVKFFLLQVSSLVTYSLSNFLILHYLAASDVTNYNVSYKYFSVILILNNIICMPLWSAFTEAYVKKDFIWIRNIIKKMLIVFVFWILVGGIMLIGSNTIYGLWTGMELNIPYSLSAVVYLFMLTCCWNGIFIAFINGIGKIQLQVLLSILPILLMLPLSKLLISVFHFGVTGIVLCMLLFNIISSLMISIQVWKILRGTDRGIWAK